MPDSPSKILPFRPRWQRFLHQGTEQVRRGDYGRAAEAFERALEEAPREPEVMLALGREYLRQGRYGEAEVLLEVAVERLPASTAATAALARVLGLHLGQAERAFELLHRGLECCEYTAPLQIVRGELLLEEGAFREARAAFGQVIDEPGTAEAARVGLARTYNAEGIALSERRAYEPAVFAFKRAADLEPEWSGPHVNLGVVFGRMGRNAKAAEAYAAALEREPDNPIAQFNLGMAHERQGHYREAVRTFERLLAREGDYPQVRAALANVLGELGEFDRAVALLLEELEIDPSSASAWTSLGLAYICTGNIERGEQCLHSALEHDPGYYNAIHNLATLYLTQQRYDEAERILRRAHELDPGRTAELLQSDDQLAQVRQLERFRSLWQKLAPQDRAP